MSSFRIQNFGGITPRLSDRLLPANFATDADNCKLWSGEIRPFKDTKEVPSTLKPGLIKSLYYLNGFWLSWEVDVDVVRGSIPGDSTGRIYYTGDGPPKVTNVGVATTTAPYPTAYYLLGVAAPSVAPTLVVGGGGTGVPEITYYVYTFVTGLDEEGPPSPPSAQISMLNGQAVTISGFSSPTTPNVTRKRIYRTQTGSTTTSYLFVAEIPVAQTTYTDTIIDALLGETLPSIGWEPPNANLRGLVSHPNGFLAGFVGNQLFISAPYQAHAWPPEYAKVFDYPIMALGVYGNTIVVATTGYTYLVYGSEPKNLTVDKLPDPYPCVSKRSMVSGDKGVVYATNEGLVWVGYGGLQVITRDIITRDEWKLWSPTTIHGVIFDGRYIGFYLNNSAADFNSVDPIGGGFIFDYNDRATGVDQRDKLTTLGFYASASYANPEVNLHIIKRKNKLNVLGSWEEGSSYIPYVWKSKSLVSPYLSTFAAAKVVGGHKRTSGVLPNRYVRFKLIVGEQVKYDRLVKTSEPFRLPRFFREVEPWSLQVEGTEYVQEIHMATSIEELKEASGGANVAG